MNPDVVGRGSTGNKLTLGADFHEVSVLRIIAINMPGNPHSVQRSIQKRQCSDTGGKAVKYHKICLSYNSGGSKDDSPLWSIFFQFHAVFGKIFAK